MHINNVRKNNVHINNVPINIKHLRNNYKMLFSEEENNIDTF